MSEKVSTMDVRARIGDMLNRVALRYDEFIILRKGQPLAALVPVSRLEQMRRFARQHGLQFMEAQKEAGGQLTDEEAMDMALEAQREARRRNRSSASSSRKKK